MESFMKSWEKAASQGAHVPSESIYFEYLTNPGRTYAKDYEGKFIECMTKEEVRQRILNIVFLGPQSPRSIEVLFDDIDQKLARVTLMEMMDSGEVELDTNLKIRRTPKPYKSLEMVRDHAVKTLVRGEKPASRQERLSRQEILELAKARPHTTTEIRQALILKGYDSYEILRQIDWLWDYGHIIVNSADDIVVFKKDL